jgi:SAM-dependent MidA family methyltransferase
VLARALDAWWRERGMPDPFVVVDAGAGPGTLARSVLEAAPACAPALRYVLVEPSPAQRRLYDERLVLADADAPGRGPICVSLPDLPRASGPAVVVANEMLEGLPFALLERGDAGWLEVRVGAGDGDALREVLVPAPADAAAMADRLAPAAARGARIPIQQVAQRWLRDALSLAAGGRVVAFDYGCDTPALASRPWTEWLRTYRSHERRGHPLQSVGELGIACEIAVDQLSLVRPPDRIATQAAWLEQHGIRELVNEARAAWAERAHVGDLDALRARSRIVEAELLLDPRELGCCRVLEWAR